MNNQLFPHRSSHCSLRSKEFVIGLSEVVIIIRPYYLFLMAEMTVTLDSVNLMPTSSASIACSTSPAVTCGQWGRSSPNPDIAGIGVRVRL